MQNNVTLRELAYGNQRISYSLTRSVSKRLRITVTPRLDVRVRAPVTATDPEIHGVVSRKAPWISKQLDRMRRFHPLPAPKRYVSGETLLYLGRQYRLRVERGAEPGAKLRGRFLSVIVHDAARSSDVRRQILNWYTRRASEVFERYMTRCAIIAARHGVPATKLVVRSMRTRWGSCTSRGRITLNLHLAQVPCQCIEYVIMHELCHLAHHDHSKAFYRLQSRCMPDWQNRKRLLEQFAIAA